MQRTRWRRRESTDIANRFTVRHQVPALPISVVSIPELAFRHFTTFLSFQAQRGHRSGFKPLKANLFTGFVAKSVGTVVQTCQSGIKSSQQFAFPVTSSQLESKLLFLCCSVIRVGKVCRLLLHVVDGAVDLVHEFFFPGRQNGIKMLELCITHVFLATFWRIRLYAVNRTRQKLGTRSRLAQR